MVKSLTRCCDEEGKVLFGFNESSFSDGENCSSSLDLSMVGLSLCDLTNGIIKLKKGEIRTISSPFLFLASKDNYFLKCGDEEKSLNLTLSFEPSFEQNDGVETVTINYDISANLSELLINWINFGVMPQNLGVSEWQNITESWSFFSTINSTTSFPITSVVDTFVGEKIEGENINFEVVIGIDGGKQLVLTFNSDEDSIITLVSAQLKNGILSTVILAETGVNEFSICFRHISIFKSIYQLFTISSLETMSFHILNENEDDVSISFLTGSKCSENETRSCCCS